MLHTPVLDWVILLSFTYFIGSMLLSALGEALAGWGRWRQKHLHQAFENCYRGEAWRTYIRSRFIKSPLIKPLLLGKGWPAYLPATTVWKVFAMELDCQALDHGVVQAAARSEYDPHPPHELLQCFREMMRSYDAMNGLQGREYLEVQFRNWYAAWMEKVSQQYKKRLRFILFVLGALVVTVLNIDTIHVSNQFFANPDVMQEVSQQVQDWRIGAGDSVYVSTPSADRPRILLGYRNWEDCKLQWTGTTRILLKIMGLLISLFALQLGAQYWFQVLNKTVNIRATGRPPEETATHQFSTHDSF